MPATSTVHLADASLTVPAAMSGVSSLAPGSAVARAIAAASADGADREGRLVYLLAGPATAADLAPVFRLVSWERLVSRAAAMNAIPALHRICAVLPEAVCPREVARQVAVLAMAVEFRMRTLERLIERLLISVTVAGIPAILLKGGGLATTVYAGFGDRPMNDVDLLVDPERAEEVRALALGLGWEVDPDLPGDDVYATHQHLPPLRDSGRRGLRLEIHRDVLPSGHPFGIAPRELREDTQRVTVGNVHALALSPLHQALHAALHFAWSHAMFAGGWHAMRDIGTLRSRRTFPWKSFVATATRWRATAPSYWTLRLARTLTGLDVPAPVLERLRPRLPEAALLRLERHFLQAMIGAEGCPSLGVARGLWTVAFQPRRSGHGPVRPWLVSPELSGVTSERGLGARTMQVVEHLGRAARWRRYLGSVLLP